MASSLSGRSQQNAWLNVAADATATSLVAAGTATQKIRVHSVVINHGDTTASSVQFNSASAACYALLKGPANGGFVLADNDEGWFETNRGEALTVTTGTGSTTGIAVTYSKVY